MSNETQSGEQREQRPVMLSSNVPGSVTFYHRSKSVDLPIYVRREVIGADEVYYHVTLDVCEIERDKHKPTALAWQSTKQLHASCTVSPEAAHLAVYRLSRDIAHAFVRGVACNTSLLVQRLLRVAVEQEITDAFAAMNAAPATQQTT